MDKDKILDLLADYGEIHQDRCDVHSEYGDGCNCAVRDMVYKLVVELTEYFSHDMEFKNEEQRKAGVEMYLKHLVGNFERNPNP